MIRSMGELAMGPNPILPVLVTAVITIVIASVAAAFALWWINEEQTRKIIRRVWFALMVLSVLGVAVFWISTTMIGPGSSIDRSMQKKQSDELQERLHKGGH